LKIKKNLQFISLFPTIDGILFHFLKQKKMKKWIAFGLGLILCGQTFAITLGSDVSTGMEFSEQILYKNATDSVSHSEFNTILGVLRGIFNDGGNIGIGAIPNLNYAFDVNGKLSADEICISDDCLSSWPAAGGTDSFETLKATCADGNLVKRGATDWECIPNAVGTLTDGKWCTSDGTVVNCTEDAPTGGTSGSSLWTPDTNIGLVVPTILPGISGANVNLGTGNLYQDNSEITLLVKDISCASEQKVVYDPATDEWVCVHINPTTPPKPTGVGLSWDQSTQKFTLNFTDSNAAATEYPTTSYEIIFEKTGAFYDSSTSTIHTGFTFPTGTVEADFSGISPMMAESLIGTTILKYESIDSALTTQTLAFAHADPGVWKARVRAINAYTESPWSGASDDVAVIGPSLPAKVTFDATNGAVVWPGSSTVNEPVNSGRFGINWTDAGVGQVLPILSYEIEITPTTTADDIDTYSELYEWIYGSGVWISAVETSSKFYTFLDAVNSWVFPTANAFVSGQIQGTGQAYPGSYCGDGMCSTNETSISCPKDCHVLTVPWVCGDGSCEDWLGENSTNCSADCTGSYACDGNGTCDSGEDFTNCPVDCCLDGSNNSSLGACDSASNSSVQMNAALTAKEGTDEHNFFTQGILVSDGDPALVFTVDGGNTDFVTPELVSGEYDIRIRAKNAMGYGAWSDVKAGNNIFANNLLMALGIQFQQVVSEMEHAVMSATQTKVQTVQSNVTALESDVTNLDTTVVNLQSDVTNVESVVSDSITDITNLVETVNSITTVNSSWGIPQITLQEEMSPSSP